jgi:hypothetical protein
MTIQACFTGRMPYHDRQYPKRTLSIISSLSMLSLPIMTCESMCVSEGGGRYAKVVTLDRFYDTQLYYPTIYLVFSFAHTSAWMLLRSLLCMHSTNIIMQRYTHDLYMHTIPMTKTIILFIFVSLLSFLKKINGHFLSSRPFIPPSRCMRSRRAAQLLAPRRFA